MSTEVTQKNIQGQLDDEIDLRQLFAMILDGRHIIAIAIAVSLLAAILYVTFATPIYKANGIILVEDHSPGVPGLDDMSEIFASESSSATEIHVIKSRLVLGQVVDELNLTTKIDAGTGLFGIFGADQVIDVADFSIPDGLHDQSFYVHAEGPVNFSLWHQDSQVLQGEIGQLVRSDDGLYEVKIDSMVADQGDRFELLVANRLETILSLQKRIGVSEKGKDTGIIEISLEGSDKNKITQIVDAISANYYLQNVQRMAAEAESSLAFLDEQIPKIREQLSSSEDALNVYRSQQSSVDLSLEAKTALEALVQVEADISTMSINEADISRRFTPQHPTYVSFKRQQSKLERQRIKISNRLEALPDTQKRIMQLKRDFEVNQAIFVALQNKRQELSILKASTVGNVRILDRAEVMPKAVSPKKGLILVLSVLLGGILGIIIIALRHFLKAGVSNPSQFSDNGLMVHATIPLSENEKQYAQEKKFLKRYRESKKSTQKQKPALLATDHPTDLSIEALRSLRTSLHFSMLGAKNNIVMVSSASPDVGKSFVTANLSAVIAQTKKRVLLIDADMRKGYLHKRLALSADNGLSELLSGTTTPAECIKKTNLDGMDVVTRGKIPTNPSELLMSEQFSKALGNLASDYDLVMVDTPPILAVTDPAIIGSYCGTSLMVARYESCTLKQVLAAKARFDQNGVDIKGVVFNAVEKKASSYYYDYGYYNYEYKS